MNRTMLRKRWLGLAAGSVVTGGLAASCQLVQPGVKGKQETSIQTGETAGSGQNLLTLLGDRGTAMLTELLNNLINKNSLLVETMNQPQVLRWSTASAPETYSLEFEELDRSLEAPAPATAASTAPTEGVYKLVCTSWFELYLTGDQEAKTGTDLSGEKVTSLVQRKFCREVVTWQTPLRKARAILPKQLGGKAVPDFSITRDLNVDFHAAVTSRPDLVSCTPWTPEEGVAKIMKMYFDYSYFRKCQLDPCAKGKICEKIKLEKANWLEYAAYPTPELVRDSASTSHTNSTRQRKAR